MPHMRHFLWIKLLIVFRCISISFTRTLKFNTARKIYILGGLQIFQAPVSTACPTFGKIYGL